MNDKPPMETTGHRTRAARRGQPLGIGPTARSQDVRLSPPRQLPLTQNTKVHLEDRDFIERCRTPEGVAALKSWMQDEEPENQGESASDEN